MSRSQRPQQSSQGIVPVRSVDTGTDNSPWQSKTPHGWQSTGSTAAPRGWTLGSTSSAQNVPRGWTVGRPSQGRGRTLLSTSSGGVYSNSEFSEDEEKLQWSDVSVSGPDPYSTLEVRPQQNKPHVQGRKDRNQPYGHDRTDRNQPYGQGRQNRNQPYTQSRADRNQPYGQSRSQVTTNIRSPYATHSVV